MEDQLTKIGETINQLQEEIASLKKHKESCSELIRPHHNPALILELGTNFDVWFRMLTGELASLGYDGLLKEPKDENGENYDPEDPVTKSKLNFVTTFILARVDDSYRQSLCDIKLPQEMIKAIREMRFPNLLSMRLTLERQWTNMVMNDSEDVLKFTN